MFIPLSLFNKMFNRFPRITTTAVLLVIGYPYGEKFTQMWYPPKTFEQGLEEGKREGFQTAKNELISLAHRNCKQTLEYIEQDAARIKDGRRDSIANVFLEDKIKIAILPRWNLSLLGDNYVVRRPLRADVNDAWFMTEESSRIIDDKIQKMFTDTEFEINPVKKDISKREIAQAVQRIIETQAKSVLQQ